jgi:hypothetical protein
MTTNRKARLNKGNCFWLFVTAGLWLSACAPMFQPAAPTLDQNSIQTVIAGTAGAAATQTALLTPPTWTGTVTQNATSTASITPSPTEGFSFILPTVTKSPFPLSNLPPSGGGTKKLSCSVAVVDPAIGAVVSPDQPFQARWTILNSGTNRWDDTAVDYVFVSGDILHLEAAYDLTRSVRSGASIEITVDMRAPATPGSYSTTWNLKDGSTLFCNMNLVIAVQ